MSSPLPPRIRKSFKRDGFYDFLIKQAEKRYAVWKRRYSTIVGLTITKKTKKRRQLQRYALVFHVTLKADPPKVINTIPRFIPFTYKKRKVNVPTDVVQTGENLLSYIHPGQNTFETSHVSAAGTLGAIVSKSGQPHILSNMHVLGMRFLTDARAHSRNVSDASPIDVNCEVNDQRRPVGVFQSGRVDSRIDAAVAYIPTGLRHLIRTMNDVFDTTDPIVLPDRVITNPFSVHMIGNVSGIRKSRAVSAIGIGTFNYPFGEQTIIKLITLAPCINVPGDSGSVVFETFSRRIMGIVLGRDRDKKFTFVIPFQTIREALLID